MAEFDQQWLPAVDSIVASHADEPGALLPILHSVQKRSATFPPKRWRALPRA